MVYGAWSPAADSFANRTRDSVEDRAASVNGHRRGDRGHEPAFWARRCAGRAAADPGALRRPARGAVVYECAAGAGSSASPGRGTSRSAAGRPGPRVVLRRPQRQDRHLASDRDARGGGELAGRVGEAAARADVSVVQAAVHVDLPGAPKLGVLDHSVDVACDLTIRDARNDLTFQTSLRPDNGPDGPRVPGGVPSEDADVRLRASAHGGIDTSGERAEDDREMGIRRRPQASVRTCDHALRPTRTAPPTPEHLNRLPFGTHDCRQDDAV